MLASTTMSWFEDAQSLQASGDYEQAIAVYEKFAAGAAPSLEQCRALSCLASVYSRVGRHDAAVEASSKALERARELGDQRATAFAQFALGTALIEAWDNGGDEFGRGMNALEQAVELYKALGNIDQFTALFTMAEACLRANELETAHSLFGVVIHHVSTDERWRASIETATRADYLRGRALAGVGDLFLRRGDPDKAEKHYEAAINLFLAGDEASARPCLEGIADTFETEMNEPAIAEEIRAATEKRFASE